MNFFHQLIRSKPVEMISSVAMVAGGAFLAVTSDKAAVTAIGTFLTGLGGVLASWSSASVGTASRAVVFLRPQLETLGKHLGTVTSQLGRVIHAANGGQMASETAFALIVQANNYLYTLVSDLQELTGRNTIHAMEEMEGSTGRVRHPVLGAGNHSPLPSEERRQLGGSGAAASTIDRLLAPVRGGTKARRPWRSMPMASSSWRGPATARAARIRTAIASRGSASTRLASRSATRSRSTPTPRIPKNLRLWQPRPTAISSSCGKAAARAARTRAS